MSITVTKNTTSVTVTEQNSQVTVAAAGPQGPAGSGATLTAGDGITLVSDVIAVDGTVIRTTGNQSVGGQKTFDNAGLRLTGSGGGVMVLNGGATSDTEVITFPDMSGTVMLIPSAADTDNSILVNDADGTNRWEQITAGDGLDIDAGVLDLSVDATVFRTTDGLAALADVSAAAQTSGFIMASSGGDYAGRALLLSDMPAVVENSLSGTVVIDIQNSPTTSTPAQVRIRMQLADGSYLGSAWDCRFTLFDDGTNYTVVKGTFGDNNGDAQVVARAGGTATIYDGDEGGNFNSSGQQDYYWRSQSDGEILLDVTVESVKTYGLRTGTPKWLAYSAAYIADYDLVIGS